MGQENIEANGPKDRSRAADGYVTGAVEAALTYADEGMNASNAAKMVLQRSPDYRLGGYNHLSLAILAAEVRRLREALEASESNAATHEGYAHLMQEQRADIAKWANRLEAELAESRAEVARLKSHNDKLSGRREVRSELRA